MVPHPAVISELALKYALSVHEHLLIFSFYSPEGPIRRLLLFFMSNDAVWRIIIYR